MLRFPVPLLQKPVRKRRTARGRRWHEILGGILFVLLVLLILFLSNASLVKP